MTKTFNQDGPDFYSEDEIICSYPKLVRNDSDMNGAVNARAQFLADHPEYLPDEYVEPDIPLCSMLTQEMLDGKIPVKVLNSDGKGRVLVEGMAHVIKFHQGDRQGAHCDVEFIEEKGALYKRWIHARDQG